MIIGMIRSLHYSELFVDIMIMIESEQFELPSLNAHSRHYVYQGAVNIGTMCGWQQRQIGFKLAASRCPSQVNCPSRHTNCVNLESYERIAVPFKRCGLLW